MQQNEDEPEKKSALPRGLDALKTLESSNETTPRQTITLGLILGVCLVFIASMLGTQNFDAPLTTALVAFVLAIPMLTMGFGLSFYRSNKTVPGWKMTEALLITAWVIEGIGGLAAAIGLYFVVWHLSHLAAIVFLIASLSVGIVCMVAGCAGLFIYAILNYKKEQKKPNPPEQ